MSMADQLLARARAGLRRLDPPAALDAQRRGAILVDTRPHEQRTADGLIPGAVVIDRNVLEWRFDPTGDHRCPEAGDRDQHVIVVCNEGYSSSLAAASLQSLGLRNATDLVGGFQAWRAAGLPVVTDG